MTIRLTKGGGPKEDTLSCFRPDGTSTWSRFIAQHDLVQTSMTRLPTPAGAEVRSLPIPYRRTNSLAYESRCVGC